MEKLTRKEALEKGYEYCIYSWGGGEDGVNEISEMNDGDFEGETVYLLGQEPIHMDEENGEVLYPRLDIELIP